MSDPFDSEILGDWLVANHLDEARRQSERQTRAAVLSLTEMAEAIDRFCDDPTRAVLPGTWQEGLRVLQARARQCLSDHGIEVIACVGQPLDPRLHRVVEVIAAPGPSETIVQQVRPGYLWRGQVLREAEVVTVSGPVE
ncbi:MAG: nucleotide exchange factor GrpE [Gemmataceae bacterium]